MRLNLLRLNSVYMVFDDSSFHKVDRNSSPKIKDLLVLKISL